MEIRETVILFTTSQNSVLFIRRLSSLLVESHECRISEIGKQDTGKQR